MTLCIALANADQIIQVTDRRLTANGRLITDDSGKSAHALTDDASMLFCFTGLAQVNRTVTTAQWLLDALVRAAERKRPSWDMLNEFGVVASEYFKANKFIQRLPASSRRLTIMFTGYTRDGYINNALVSNFQDFIQFVDHADARPEFNVVQWRSNTPARDNPTMIQVVGQFGAFTEQDEAELRDMLVKRLPGDAIRAKAIAVLRDIADRPSSGSTVGKRVNSGRLNSASPTMPIVGYSSDQIDDSIYMLNAVDLRLGGNGLRIFAPEMKADAPIVFPRRHRNHPCSCGSGKKYRHCHGAKR